MYHSFNVDIAKEYGLLEAVLINNFQFWISHNQANGVNFHDGKYWTFNSSKAFSELFPYASKRQIEYALKKLKDAGVIETANYNKDQRDKTLWYTFSDNFVKCKLQICDMEITKLGNANTEIVTPLPNINTDVNAITNTDIYSEIINYLNERAGTNYRASSKKTREHIHARFEDGFTKEDFFTVIDKKCADWLHDKQMAKFLRPETLFATKFESYLNQPMREMTTKDLASNMNLSGFFDDIM